MHYTNDQEISELGLKIRLVSSLSISLASVLLGMEILLMSRAGGADLWSRVTTLVLASLLLSCTVYALITILLPLSKARRIAGMLQKDALQAEKSERLYSKFSSLGGIGALIENAARLVNSETSSRILNAEVALYALQSQINPHFLYNTLETIRNYATNYGVPEVAEMTQSLATIFRYSISRLGEVATMSDEIENVRNYLKIQNYRFPNRFETVWLIDEEDDEIMKYTLPVLTLQPLVENALSHGLEGNLTGGRITIRATTTQSKLIVSVSDNGAGISQGKIDEIREKLKKNFYAPSNTLNKSVLSKSGISLNNVNQRIKLYFGQDYGLSIMSVLEHGTTVEVVVPKIK